MTGRVSPTADTVPSADVLPPTTADAGESTPSADSADGAEVAEPPEPAVVVKPFITLGHAASAACGVDGCALP